jgi:hypothetical protein
MRFPGHLPRRQGFPVARSEEHDLEPLQHPDLRRLGNELRRRHDDILDAELHAARAAARRRRSLRDLLLEAEDRGDPARLATADGQWHAGRITAVGSDHVEITDRGIRRVLALGQLTVVQLQ